MKQKIILAILGIILILLSSSVGIDWFQFFTTLNPEILLNNPFNLYSKIAKVTVSFLFCMIVWITGKNALDNKDRKLMFIGFSCVFLADLLLAFGPGIPGGLVFLICHVIFLIRNSRGFKWKFTPAAIVCLVLCYALGGLFFTFMLLPLIPDPLIAIAAAVYVTVICSGLFTGWNTLWAGFFPKKNALMAALGITGFVICDFLVVFVIAATMAAPAPSAWVVLACNYFVWIFYTPGMILLGLSGYNPDFFKCFKKGGVSCEQS